jgi:hypothetical protein
MLSILHRNQNNFTNLKKFLREYLFGRSSSVKCSNDLGFVNFKKMQKGIIQSYASVSPFFIKHSVMGTSIFHIETDKSIFGTP